MRPTTRLTAALTAAILLAACSQSPSPVGSPPEISGLNAGDAYVLNAENVPLPIRPLFRLKPGQGIEYRGAGTPSQDRVLLTGYRYLGLKKLNANQAKVVSDGTSNALSVVRAGTNVPNPDGGILRIKPPKSYGTYSLTSLTVRDIDKDGAFVRITADGLDTTYALPVANGPSQTLELDSTGVEVVHVNAHDAFSVDDVVFELPDDDATPVCTGTVTFPDGRLQHAVGRALGTQDMACSNIEQLVRMNASNYGILSNLEGIQYAVNIESLDLNRNAISDLTPLKDLANLKDLNLRSNRIEDIGVLVANPTLAVGDVLVALDQNCLDLTPGSKAQLDVATLEARNPAKRNVTTTLQGRSGYVCPNL